VIAADAITCKLTVFIQSRPAAIPPPPLRQNFARREPFSASETLDAFTIFSSPAGNRYGNSNRTAVHFGGLEWTVSSHNFRASGILRTCGIHWPSPWRKEQTFSKPSPGGSHPQSRRRKLLRFRFDGHLILNDTSFICRNGIKYRHFIIRFRHGVVVALNEQGLFFKPDQLEIFTEMRRPDPEASRHLLNTNRMFIQSEHRGWRHLGSARGA
jgi:hypothetical protein